jgi:hypothetical protein
MVSTSPTVVDVDVNPADTDQRYVLWSNGYVQAYGGAPAITSGPNWFDRVDQPVGVAFHITDWATGAGYVLDYTGKFWPLNGATPMGTGGYVSGVPQSDQRKYCDWAWDPDNPTRGAVLDEWGQVYVFGGLTACPRAGRRWSHPRAKKCKARFTPDLRLITLDMYGGLHGDYNSAGFDDDDRWPGWDAGRDFCVTDWDNHKGYVLDLYGGHSDFGGAKKVYGYRFKEGVDCGRRHHCLDPVKLKFWVIWDGGIEYEFTSAQPPTVAAGGGTNEQQQVTITGAPTGGGFRLTYSGQTTAAGALLWDSTGDDVQAALEALSNIAVGDVEAWGDPGGPYTIEFTGALGSTDFAQMTVSNTFTGGTSPTATVTTLTNGSGQLSPSATVTTTSRPTLSWSYGDPDHSAQNAWELYVFTQTYASGHDMSDPSSHASSAVASAVGYQPSQRGVRLAHDFANDAYRFFIRVQNKIGLWSSWSSCAWVQNVPPPPTPFGLTAAASGFSVDLHVSCTIDGTADSVIFEYSDDGGDTWNAVRGAEAVPIATSVSATDYDIPLGVTRTYRSYIYKAFPRYLSSLSNTRTATVTTLKYVLTSVDDPTLGGEIRVVEAPEFTSDSDAGVFKGIGAKYPVVVSDGVPKARKETVVVETNSAAEYATLMALVNSNTTLVYRNPFGEVVYCRVVGTVSRKQIKRFPQADELTPLMHSHQVSIPLVEIEPPLLLDVGFTVPPGPTGPQ